MILELVINEGDVLITGTKVSLEEAEVKLPIPKKTKGKEITFAKFNSKMKEFHR